MANSMFLVSRRGEKDLPKVGDCTRPANCRGPVQGDSTRSIFLLVEHAQCRDYADETRRQGHLGEKI